MSENEILRRPSYGPTSPSVGQRGERTRARIVAATLELFESHGFHGTSVDDIARAAGVSRATLYQYFESKEQIFLELLDECGTALMRVIRRLGPLGPTALGFDNLHWWLGEWAWVYDKYATMYVQWANVDSPRMSVRPLVTGFIDAYNRRITERLEASGVAGIDPADAAMMVSTVVDRFNYFRHVGLTEGHSTEELIDNLAVVIQLMLFPLTPAAAFAQIGTEPTTLTRPARRSARPDAGALSLLSSRSEPGPGPNRLSELSPRAAATVRRLLDAGARSFADHGYHLSSVDDIVAEAGFARGTFYKYFDEKLDLLVALSDEWERLTEELNEKADHIIPGVGGPEQLRRWITEFAEYQERYFGVTRTWLDKTPTDARLTRTRRRVAASARAANVALLRRVERPYPLDVDVARSVLFVILERLPEILAAATGGKSREDMIELVARVIERGLLNGRPS